MSPLSPWFELQSISSLILFFVASLTIYHFSPAPWRWLVLLIASYAYYFTQSPRYWYLIPAETLILYVLALMIARTPSLPLRRLCLSAGIIALLLPLLWLKYWSPGLQQVAGAVPLGLSFYTFQGLSYLIDVYWRRIQVERHPGHLAAFNAFFPQLIAGPIERAENLLPQIKKPAAFDHLALRTGLMLVLIGVFKKFVIANNIVPFVDATRYSPAEFSGFPILLGAVLTRYHAYADFSGYTDIAIGLALCFGIRIGPNFDRPFAATSVGDYWQRWHISLVSWFRNYVYFPLCRVNSSSFGIRSNMFLLMVLVGVWHGGTLGWLLFGVSNAVLMLIGNLTSGARRRFRSRVSPRLHPALSHGTAVVSTFLYLCIPSFISNSRDWEDFKERLLQLINIRGGWIHPGAFRKFFELDQVPLIFFGMLFFIFAMEIAQHWWAHGGDGQWKAMHSSRKFALLLLLWTAFLVFANPSGPEFSYIHF